MKHCYTQNSLISYLFGELSILAKLEIEHWLEEDASASLELNVMKDQLSAMPKVNFSPSTETVNSILFLSSSANAALI